jgi:transposase
VIRRKKKKGRKAEIIKDLPVEEIHHRLSEEERMCPCCACQMKRLGETKVRDEVVYIPASIFVRRHFTESLYCDACIDEEVEGKIVVTAVVPKPPIRNSLASPSLLAQILHNKFRLSLPLYRQVDDWNQYGLKASYRTLINWVNIANHDWLSGLYKLIHQHIMSQEKLHADETVYQVLNRTDGKPATSEARIWLATTTEDAKLPAVYYQSSLSRSQACADELLTGFRGYLHTDGYQVYKNIKGIIQVGCWAHTRRKFKDVKSKAGIAGVAISYCDKLFKIERKLAELPADRRKQKRIQLLKPIMDEFFNWLLTVYTVKGKLQTAVEYALNQKESLMNILYDGELSLSNNFCERGMRIIAIGRKNYLFSTSVKGAQANAMAYTLMETAKLNGINDFKYLEYLFTHLPNINFHRYPELLVDFLPWSHSIQNYCK